MAGPAGIDRSLPAMDMQCGSLRSGIGWKSTGCSVSGSVESTSCNGGRVVVKVESKNTFSYELALVIESEQKAP